MKKIALFVNGKSGTGSLQNQTYRIIENLSVDGNEITVSPINPDKSLFSDDIIRAHGSEYDLLVCAGGDGTLNHVVNSVMTLEKKPILGYIPAGSTNDFARSISIPSQIDQACDIILHGKPFAYDIGQLNQKYFDYVAAFGAFSSISYSTEQNIKNLFGHLAYILSAIGELPQQMNQKCHMKITTDSFSVEDDFLFGAIYSSNFIGGIDISNFNHASLDDGKYEILLIKYTDNLIELGQMIPSLLDKQPTHPDLVYGTITKANILSEEIAWSIDGEFGGTTNEANFSVHNQAITIMIPND